MTPAIDQLIKLGITYQIHEYTHASSAVSYGMEAAQKMGVVSQRVFKTLVVDAGNKRLAVAVLPVDQQLNLKLMAKAIGAKKASMADPDEVSRSSGYVLGGVSPIGQKRGLTTVIDISAEAFESIYVSGGRRGLEIELAARDLATVTEGQFAAIT
ncbi:MAG: Cys-tRNA(Pro) deacylase [Oceanospirillaceae bacterium]|nr:Cys-tRNA(Pro) deacylase [Oceanospirillaceae bacterium]